MQFGVLVDAVLQAGRVLGGVQFGVPVEGHAACRAGGCCSRVMVRGWCIVMMTRHDAAGVTAVLRYGLWV